MLTFYFLVCFKIEDEMIQCIVCEDWYHSRVNIGVIAKIVGHFVHGFALKSLHST